MTTYIRDNAVNDETILRRDNAFSDIFFSSPLWKKPEASYVAIFPAALSTIHDEYLISQYILDTDKFMSSETHSSVSPSF